MTLPFLALLALIALGPLAFHHLWEKFYPLAAVGLGAVTIGYYLLVLHQPAKVWHTAAEYFSFIAFIGSLFIIAGGIHIRIKGEATPAVNCLFLFAGAIAANFIGTTGASMLLIRPWIQMNKYRVTTHHIVFFIFIVGNAGGCLTPIGDPPLFLGYIRGVPFWWVLTRCWEAWLIMVGILLAVFYVADVRNFRRAPAGVRARQTEHEEWHVSGLLNLWFLALALGAVFLPFGWREALLVGSTVASWWTTPEQVHRSNHFNFAPISEVAWLFAGIFATMLPALSWLELHAARLGLSEPVHFYWLTGALSGFLDNAPTYLAFLAAAFGLAGLEFGLPENMPHFIASHDRFLVAISVSSVFFGAMTYLGNGPNFMIKSIAQQQKVETPGFLGYILRYSLPVMAPALLLLSLLFFSRWRVF